MGGDALTAGKVTAGLAESNDSLPPGGWLKVTCGLTACTPELAPGQTLANMYGRTLPSSLYNYFIGPRLECKVAYLRLACLCVCYPL